MSDDKIAEIRKRHEDVSWRYYELPVIYEDRAYLLAEVDRREAENERLLQAIGLATTAVPDMEIDVTDPIGMMQRVVAKVARRGADIERLREALEYIVNVCPAIDPDGDQAHERARKALEGKP